MEVLFYIFKHKKHVIQTETTVLCVPLQTSCSLSGFDPLEEGSAPYFIGSEE